LALVAFLVGQPARADKVGDQFQVNTTSVGVQLAPRVAALARGGFAVTWVQAGGGLHGAYVQQFTPKGVKRGAEFKATAKYASFPSIAGLPNGDYVVNWHNANATRGQRFTPHGLPKGTEFTVTTAEASGRLTVGSFADSGFVVAWQAPDSSFTGIFAQRFTPLASKTGDAFRVNSRQRLQQTGASLATLTDGRFVISWDGLDGSKSGVFAQRFNPTGRPLGGEFRVNDVTSSYQGQSAAASLQSGRFVVVWADGQDSSPGIYGQRFAASGARIGGTFKINTSTNGNPSSPAVARLVGGGFVVAWNAPDSPPWDQSVNSIYGRRYTEQGQPVGGEFLVNTATAGVQRSPDVSGLLDGGFVVVWYSGRYHGTGQGIFGQRFNLENEGR